jgi:hypothetical protein
MSQWGDSDSVLSYIRIYALLRSWNSRGHAPPDIASFSESQSHVHPILAAMLSRSTRTTMRAVRSFATAVEAAGLKVAALDHGQPTAAVTLLVKAGSRYETQQGTAHLLKNFAFKVRGLC